MSGLSSPSRFSTTKNRSEPTTDEAVHSTERAVTRAQQLGLVLLLGAFAVYVLLRVA
jgi:hypothetical protein